MTKRKVFAMAATVMLAVSPALVIVNNAAPAYAAGCRVTWVSQTKGFNDNCTWGQHYNRLSDGTTMYGNVAGPQSWSWETKSYIGLVDWGMISSGQSTGATL